MWEQEGKSQVEGNWLSKGPGTGWRDRTGIKETQTYIGDCWKCHWLPLGPRSPLYCPFRDRQEEPPTFVFVNLRHQIIRNVPGSPVGQALSPRV